MMADGESAKPTIEDALAEAFGYPAHPPERLYHYTDQKGLFGITDSHALWASDARYLNDASEVTYADAVVSESVEAALGAVDKADRVGTAVSQLVVNINASSYSTARPFVACFCEDGDLLSQWRGYGWSDPAYALGFDFQVAGAVTLDDLPGTTHLVKVIYDEERQRDLVSKTVDAWVATLRSFDEPQNPEPLRATLPPAFRALVARLREFRLSFKHPTFREEQEWRLIRLVDVKAEGRRLDRRFYPSAPEPQRWGDDRAEGVEIKHRGGVHGLIPYVELPLRVSVGALRDRLPLRNVVQGPTPDADTWIEPLRSFLVLRGYPDVFTRVRASGIPLRR